MSAQPLVSVILPTFNRLRYLRPAIESVFAQTFGQWELIIADDGSGVETRAYLESLATAPQVKVLWLEHSANPGAVRNVAMREARGEYLAFLDSDDLWLPSKLELQLAALRASPAHRWGYTEFIRIDPAGESIDSQRNPHRVLHEGQIFERLLKLKVGIAMPTVMVERALIERAGDFDEQQGLHEDYEMWLRLALLSEVGVIKQPLACVRRHAEHFSSGGVRTFEARRRVLEKMSGLIGDPDQRRVLRAEEIRNETMLARASAVAGDRRGLWRVLARSWRHSWSSPVWYLTAVKAVTRAFVPARLVSFVRRRRRAV